MSCYTVIFFTRHSHSANSVAKSVILLSTRHKHWCRCNWTVSWFIFNLHWLNWSVLATWLSEWIPWVSVQWIDSICKSDWYVWKLAYKKKTYRSTSFWGPLGISSKPLIKQTRIQIAAPNLFHIKMCYVHWIHIFLDYCLAFSLLLLPSGKKHGLAGE